MLLLITYALKEFAAPERHAAIAEVITTNALDYRQIMRFGWLVYTKSGPLEWGQLFMGHFGQGESAIVTQLHREEGWAFIGDEERKWMDGKL